MIRTWYFGFWKPSLRNLQGKIDWRCWAGHVCCFGHTDEDTWLFFDPKGAGPAHIITHMHDEVMLQLEAHMTTCDMVLRLPARPAEYRVPFHGPMTCAAICGYLVGIRASFPHTLRRRLLALGAEEIVNVTERRSR